jgi:hypothetical protein
MICVQQLSQSGKYDSISSLFAKAGQHFLSKKYRPLLRSKSQ